MDSKHNDIAAVLQLARADIRALAPYAHARWAPQLERLHANESPWPPLDDPASSSLHRYPEPQPRELVQSIAARYGVTPEQILVGRGSDEGIDLLTRAFCEAGRSKVIVCPPTFGMYAVAAKIQGATVDEVPLDEVWQPDPARIARALTRDTRIVWLCSPNNPTGNTVERVRFEAILELTAGRALLVVDEAYGEFSPDSSVLPDLPVNPHLIVLRTLSKAAGLAGARLGTLIAHPEIVSLVRKILPPYALPTPSIQAGLRSLQPAALAIERTRLAEWIRERDRLAERLRALAGRDGLVRRVWASEANFLLVEVTDATEALARIAAQGLIVRDFTGKFGDRQVLRLTVGTAEQNERLVKGLSEHSSRAGVIP